MIDLLNNSGFLSRAQDLVRPASAAKAAEKALSPTPNRSDAIELSGAALDYDTHLSKLPNRIRQIRDQIAKDEYLTPQKIDTVVDRLHRELTTPPQQRLHA